MSRKDWPATGLEQLGRCPLCGAVDREQAHPALVDTLFGAPGSWIMWRCGRCRSGYLDPRPTEATIGLAYSAYYTHDMEPPPLASDFMGQLRRALGNDYRKWRYGVDERPRLAGGGLVAMLVPRMRQAVDLSFRYLPRARAGRLLDVGCGDGTFLKRARTAGWSVCGTDPDAKARERAAADGLDIRASLDDLAENEQFDAITLNHVIEHVHDARATLKRCHDLLRPGGFLYIETPNMEALGHEHWQADWRGLEPPRHLQLFTPASLHDLLAEVGFGEVKDRPRPNAFFDLSNQSAAMRRERDSSAAMPEALPPEQIEGEANGPRRELLTVTARKNR